TGTAPRAPAPGRRPRSTHPTSSGSAIAVEIAQELVVAVEHDHALAVRECLAVGLQAALEGIERGVAIGGLGVDPCSARIALASQPLGVALGLGDDHLALPVGLRADGLCLLRTFGAQAAGDLVALGPHAAVDVLDDLAVGRQVDALQPQVDDPDADGGGAPVDRLQLL